MVRVKLKTSLMELVFPATSVADAVTEFLPSEKGTRTWMVVFPELSAIPVPISFPRLLNKRTVLPFSAVTEKVGVASVVDDEELSAERAIAEGASGGVVSMVRFAAREGVLTLPALSVARALNW